MGKLKTKCKPVCPVENSNCCMAQLLSQQDDFKNQVSMLEVLVKERGHEIIFLPKFHCELNPIEMVSNIFIWNKPTKLKAFSIGDGSNIAIGSKTSHHSKQQRMQQSSS